MGLTDYAQWAGSVTALVGAGLLASRVRLSPWGFVLFLISNVFLLFYSVSIGAWGLLVMNIGFAVINLLGVKRWLLNPGA